MRRHYVASTSVRRHVPAGNVAPLAPPSKHWPPNILNLPTPMNSGLHSLVETMDLEPLHCEIESGYLHFLMYLFYIIITTVLIQPLCLFSDSPTFYPF